MTCTRVVGVWTWYGALIRLPVLFCILMISYESLSPVMGYTERDAILADKSLASVDPYTHHKLPLLKMLKRQTRNFRRDRKTNATVTLVFHARGPVDVNWFSFDVVDSQTVKYPIFQDHPIYDTRYLTSGDVTATTVVIPARHHDRDHTFETVITTHDHLLQYQIQTVLDTWTVYSLDNIDSPEWLAVPPTHDHVDAGNDFRRHCRSYVHLEKGGNALKMLHASLSDGDTSDWPVYQSLYQTHDSGMEEGLEEAEAGSMILEGQLIRVGRDRAVCDVRATQTPAKLDREGIYMCAVDRMTEGNKVLDKLFLVSYLTFGQHKSVRSLLRKVRVELLTCATTNNDLVKSHVHLHVGKLGCVRCRGFGFPLPSVDIYKKKGFDVPESLSRIDPQGVAVTRYTNLAEVLVAEVVYVFRNPRQTLRGSYMCAVKNDHAEVSKDFEIKVR